MRRAQRPPVRFLRAALPVAAALALTACTSAAQTPTGSTPGSDATSVGAPLASTGPTPSASPAARTATPVTSTSRTALTPSGHPATTAPAAPRPIATQTAFSPPSTAKPSPSAAPSRSAPPRASSAAPAGTSVPSSLHGVHPSVTYAGSTGAGRIQVSAVVPGVEESDGTCTATLTSGGRSATATAAASAGPSSTTCGSLVVSTAGLPTGLASVVVRYSSPHSAGTSAAASVEVS